MFRRMFALLLSLGLAGPALAHYEAAAALP